jgi:hypothetical protein
MRMQVFRYGFSLVLVAALALLVTGGIAVVFAEAPAAPAMQIIPSEEVKDAEGDQAQQQVSLEDVEKARRITADRIYGLAALWVLIILGIVLLRWQVRDDEKLYEEGYYNRNLE